MVGLAWVGYLLLSQSAVAKREALSRANLIGGAVHSQGKGCVAEEPPKKLVQEVKKRNRHHGL